MANQYRLAAVVALGIAAAAAGIACSSSDDPPPLGALPPPAGDPNAPGASEALLEKDTGVPWLVDIDPRRGTPDLVMPASDPAPIAIPGEALEAAALRFLEKYKSVFKIDSAAGQLSLEDKDVDPSGLTHVRFAQSERGVPVFGAGYDVHLTQAGAIAYVGGDFVSGLASASISPAIDEATAIAAAEKELAAELSGPVFANKKARLAFLPRDNAGAVLAFEVELSGDDAAGAAFAERLFVDAKQGTVVERYELIHSESVTARGVRSFAPINDASATKSISVRKKGAGPDLEMVRAGEGTTITTRTKAVATPIVLPGGTGDDWNPQAPNTDGAGAAVDAHFHMAETDAWFREKFGRRGYDNLGAGITLIVHDNTNGNDNAFWDNRSALHFGDGTANNGGNWLASVGLETMGHEYSHAVTQYTSRLVYRGESGALNESISDVFAACLFKEKRPSGGDPLKLFAEESLDGTPLRDMLHPGRQGQPDHYDSRHTDPKQDYGGVHANSGIPNNAFALMTMGGTQDTSKIKVEAMGWEDARKLWWQSERYNLRASSQFGTHARLQIAAAKKLGMKVEPVACAWVAVGVVTAGAVKSQYGVTCAPDPALPDCSTEAANSCETRYPGQNAICSFNGDRSCCKRSFAVTTVCFSNDDCTGGQVCALATNSADGGQQFSCTPKDEPRCLDGNDAGAPPPP